MQNKDKVTVRIPTPLFSERNTDVNLYAGDELIIETITAQNVYLSFNNHLFKLSGGKFDYLIDVEAWMFSDK